MDPQFNTDPLPASAIVLSLEPPVGAFIVIAPVPPEDVVTFRVKPSLIVSVVGLLPPLMVRLAQDALTGTVTAILSLIITLSAAVGGAAPPQVAATFHGPLTEATFCAFATDAINITPSATAKIFRL